MNKFSKPMLLNHLTVPENPAEQGCILYRCSWIPGDPLSEEAIEDLQQWRDEMRRHNLIGVYPNGIGFGNLSKRFGAPGNFIISGTQTGSLAHLTAEHYTLVTAFSFSANYLSCVGPIKASSEALSHAAVYLCSTQINAIIHFHHAGLWRTLHSRIPTSTESAPAGTPELAWEIDRLYQQTNLRDRRLLVMGGHEEGLLAFGSSLNEAGETINSALEAYSQA